jgi:hypothetical protein
MISEALMKGKRVFSSLRNGSRRCAGTVSDAKHRIRNLEIPGLVLRTIPE